MLQAGGLEEREGHAELERAANYLNALKEYIRRFEPKSIRFRPLPSRAIPLGFEAQCVEVGYLRSFERRGDGLGTMFTVHHFAPSDSIPEMRISPMAHFQFYPRADLMVTAQMFKDHEGCVNLTGKCCNHPLTVQN